MTFGPPRACFLCRAPWLGMAGHAIAVYGWVIGLRELTGIINNYNVGVLILSNLALKLKGRAPAFLCVLIW